MEALACDADQKGCGGFAVAAAKPSEGKAALRTRTYNP
jgi:hypothetical protein